LVTRHEFGSFLDFFAASFHTFLNLRLYCFILAVLVVLEHFTKVTHMAVTVGLHLSQYKAFWSQLVEWLKNNTFADRLLRNTISGPGQAKNFSG
jgi:hypothetical protein